MLKTKLLSFLITVSLTLISCELPDSNYETVLKDELFRNEILKNNPGEYIKLLKAIHILKRLIVTQKLEMLS